jgi:hypothetical protein
MLTVVYSFNKRGREAEFWSREIAGASDGDVAFTTGFESGYGRARR